MCTRGSDCKSFFVSFNLKKGVAGVHLLNVVFLCTSKTMEAAYPAVNDTFSKVI